VNLFLAAAAIFGPILAGTICWCLAFRSGWALGFESGFSAGSLPVLPAGESIYQGVTPLTADPPVNLTEF
jgi:hypothetical protein